MKLQNGFVKYVLFRREEKRKANKILFYLEKTGQYGPRNLIKVLENELVYLNKVRKTCNQFVHRELDQIEERYNKIRLCDVFHVTSFFTEIEKSACS